MKVSLNWLKEFLAPETAAGLDAATAAQALTMVGLEVEGVEEHGRELAGVVVAEVLSVRPHPNADKLRLVRVRAGAREEEVVCGAANVPPPGNRVCWAPPGARLPGGRALEAREVRGVLSPGMLCSEQELGFAALTGDKGEGILILAPTDPSGAELVQHAGIADDVLDVNVTPNRPDALSHLGVARELAAALGSRVRVPAVPQARVAAGAPTMDVRLADGSGCQRYQARFIGGVSVAPAPLWLRLRLAYCGVRAISNLVDVTNYVLLGLGHPLHAFDVEKLAGPITVRRAREGELIVTLDGQERRLLAGDIVIADERGPVALAGVMGGASSEVTTATRNLLLEAATFDPVSVRRTSRRLGLISESSYRYERGVDAEGIPLAADVAQAWLATLGGGTIAPTPVDRYPAPPTPRPVRLRLSRLERVTGLPFDLASARAELEKVAVSVAVEGAGESATLVATVPTYRPDLTLEEDLIEEVLRLGRHYARPARPERVLSNARPAGHPDAAAERVRDVLAAAGLSEVVSWGFVPRAALEIIGGPEDPRRADGVVVKNPISADYEVMRTSLLPGLADALKRNVARGLADVALFEVGPVIHRAPEPGQEPVQGERAAALLVGREAGWLKPGEPLDFFDAKRLAEDVLLAFGVEASFVAPAGVSYLHPGVSARIVLPGDRAVGLVGEIDPRVGRRLGIEQRVLYVELDVTALAGARTRIQSEPPPRYPAATRDVSFWVDANVPADAQRAAFHAAAEPLLRDLRVLEDFRDPRYVPQGRKGMLWTMTYRADDRTLTDAETDAAHARVLAALQERLEIQVR